MHTRLSLALALLPLTLAPLCPARAQTAAPQAATKPTLTVLHSTHLYAEQPLTFGADGALYGVTPFGGADNSGTVFKVTRGGLFHPLADLYGKNGMEPSGPLLLMPDGALMGAATFGGKSNTGALFLLTPPHRFQTKHEFAVIDSKGRNTRGAAPSGALALGPDGVVYGTTRTGGSGGHGVVYRWTAAHGVEVLHDFLSGDMDGDTPQGLTLGSDGALYGVTLYGGAHGVGIVYRLTTDGLFTLLHSFRGADGENPEVPPIFGKDGALYGVTYQGGPEDGVAYRITTDGDFTLLHAFVSGTEGYGTNGLTLAPDGSFYGSNALGGSDFGFGTIFHMAVDGHVTVLYTFQDLKKGRFPASVTLGPDGALYGTTTGGGAYNSGIAFKLRLP